MIQEMNTILQTVGSNFSTLDGVTFTSYIGNMTFINKTYTSIEEAYRVVKSLIK